MSQSRRMGLWILLCVFALWGCEPSDNGNVVTDTGQTDTVQADTAEPPADTTQIQVDTPEPPTDTSTLLNNCSSNDDCAAEQFCSPTSGVCELDGVCKLVEDCSVEGNDYAVDDCIGNIECVQGQCTMVCDTGCASNDDCADNEYCNADGECAEDGSCNTVADCSIDGNSFTMIECEGPLVCSNNQCTVECATQGCSWDDDCLAQEYCDGSGTCVPDGSCTVLADCSVEGNQYELALCPGATLLCENGLCIEECPAKPEPCADLNGVEFGACQMFLGWAPLNGVCAAFSGCSDQGYTFYATEAECQTACNIAPPAACGPNNTICQADEYCSYNGTCQAMQACTFDADCAHPNNLYNKPKCFGVGLCKEGLCEWDCGVAACQNIEGVDFGNCEAELGWMVLGEACVMMSGCSDQGFETFATQEECNQACGLGVPPSGGKCHQKGDGTDTCDAGSFCDSLSCTITEGECKVQADNCIEIYDPVCGCDGQTYSNNCFRIKAGVSKDYDGECTTTPTGCTDDSDCAPGGWCYNVNPTVDGTCIPYQQEGEDCGGFPPPGSPLKKCDPDLVCSDIPPFLPDATGVCRPPCTTNADCPDTQYCSDSQAVSVCMDDGSCWFKSDCDIEANIYPANKCSGYSICDNQNQCGWICGNEQCQDVTGVQFGPCSDMLGYILKDGQCQSVSGCNDQGYTFYTSVADCDAACTGGNNNGGGVDLSNWTIEGLSDTGTVTTFTFPAGTTLNPGISIVIGRNTDGMDFATHWGAMPKSTLYFKGSNTTPVVNNKYTYSLLDPNGNVVDGPTVTATTKKSNQRTCANAASANCWNAVNESEGTPGVASTPTGIPAGTLFIGEMADASGSGNYKYEFIEISISEGGGNNNPGPVPPKK